MPPIYTRAPYEHFETENYHNVDRVDDFCPRITQSGNVYYRVRTDNVRFIGTPANNIRWMFYACKSRRILFPRSLRVVNASYAMDSLARRPLARDAKFGVVVKLQFENQYRNISIRLNRMNFMILSDENVLFVYLRWYTFEYLRISHLCLVEICFIDHGNGWC